MFPAYSVKARVSNSKLDTRLNITLAPDNGNIFTYFNWSIGIITSGVLLFIVGVVIILVESQMVTLTQPSDVSYSSTLYLMTITWCSCFKGAHTDCKHVR